MGSSGLISGLISGCLAMLRQLRARAFSSVRHDWTRKEVRKGWSPSKSRQVGDIYHQPLLELAFQAAAVHRQHFDPREVQQSTLLSIKTGLDDLPV